MGAKNPAGPSRRRLPVSAMESPKLYMALMKHSFDSARFEKPWKTSNKDGRKEKKVKIEAICL